MRTSVFLLLVILNACNSDSDKNSSFDNSSKSDSLNLPVSKYKIGETNKIETAVKFNLQPQDLNGEDTLTITIENTTYKISPTGLFAINQEKSVQLTTELYIDDAYFFNDSSFYYIFFTDTDFDGATSWLQKISKNDLNTEYTTPIRGFNLGKPIIINGKAFVSAIGFIGKLDLKTGIYNWEKDDLYDREKYSFNSFDTVELHENLVEFISKHYKTNKIDKVIVDNTTGKIIDIIK